MQTDQPVVQSNYRKNPVSIPELNNFFMSHPNDSTVFNQVEKEFRNYVSTFSLVKKKVDAVEIIKNQFKQITLAYQEELEEQFPNLDDRALDKKVKKFKKIQTKCWNLNLIYVSNIRTVCDQKNTISDYWLQQIASVIRNDYHE